MVLACFGPGYCKESDGVKLGKCFRSLWVLAELVKLEISCDAPTLSGK